MPIHRLEDKRKLPTEEPRPVEPPRRNTLIDFSPNLPPPNLPPPPEDKEPIPFSSPLLQTNVEVKDPGPKPGTIAALPPATGRTTSFAEIYSDPGYLGLSDEEQTSIRRDFFRQETRNPRFRALDRDERQIVARNILFPESQFPTKREGAIPQPSTGEMFRRGLEAFQPGPGERTGGIMEAGRQALGLAEMIASPGAPFFNLMTRGSERVSDFFRERGAERTADIAGATAKAISDVVPFTLLGKGRAFLRKRLPTIKEKITDIRETGTARQAGNIAERERRLAQVEQEATQAQLATVRGQAERSKEITRVRGEIDDRTLRDLTGVDDNLKAQQQLVGKEAAQAAGPLPPKRTRFGPRYNNVESAGEFVVLQPVNLNATSRNMLRERGIPGVQPVLQGEKAAAGLTRQLTLAGADEVDEEIANIVQRMITEGSGAAAKKPNFKEIIRTVLGPVTADDVNMAELFRARKRLRAGARRAYDLDQKNLGRQFRTLEDSITQDLIAAGEVNPSAKKLFRLHKRIDDDYFKQKAVEWYAEGLDQAFNPATGVWDRKRFTRWFEKYSDVNNQDRELRRLLGTRYEGTKGLVGDMQKATELNIEGAAKVAARNLKRRRGEELRDIGARKTAAAKAEKITGEQGLKAQKEIREAVETESAARAKDIEREIRARLSEVSANQAKAPGRLVGNFMMYGGMAGFTGGVLTGNLPAIGVGAVSMVEGSMILAHSNLIAKILNTVRGLSIIRNLTRAVPGTAQAVTAANAFMKLAGEIGAGEEPAARAGPQPATREEQVQTVLERQRSSRGTLSPKDVLLERYGIR